MSRLGILSNARSSGNRKGLEAVSATAQEANVPHIVTRHVTEVEPALRALAENGVDILAINGGDGTLRTTLSLLRRRPIFPCEPIFALLRGGTTNMVHRDTGLRGAPAEALRRLIPACRADLGKWPIVTRSVIAVQRPNGDGLDHGFFFGAAAIPRAIRLTRERLHPSGLTGPTGEGVALAWMLLRLLSGRVGNDPVLRPDDIAYALDDQGWREGQVVFLMVTTLDRLILGLRPVAANGNLGFAALTWPYRRLWRTLPRFLRGRLGPGTDDGLTRAHAQRIALRASGSYVLDGELLTADAATPLSLHTAEPARFLVV